MSKFKITDLSYDFFSHPVTGNLVLSRNQDAIKQSIKTLLFLNIFEKPYVSGINVQLKKYLFENINILDVSNLKTNIRFLLSRFEPRINVNNVDIFPLENSNAIIIQIDYSILNETIVPDSVSFVFGKNK